MPQTLALRGDNGRQTVVSRMFDIDNGSGTTVDDALLRCSKPITILAAYVLYTTATTGTVAAATIQLGTSVGGADVITATALENTKAVGVKSALTLATRTIAADTPLIARHTGIPAGAAGEYRLVVEYEVNN